MTDEMAIGHYFKRATMIESAVRLGRPPRRAHRALHPMPDADGLREGVDAAPPGSARRSRTHPRARSIEVEGADIESLAWGERGRQACCCCTASPRMRTGGASSPRSSRRRGEWSRFHCPAWAVRAGATRIRSSSTHARRSPWRRLQACSRPRVRRSSSGTRSEVSSPGSSHSRLGPRIGGIVLVDGVIDRGRRRRRIRRRAPARPQASRLSGPGPGHGAIPLLAAAAVRTPVDRRTARTHFAAPRSTTRRAARLVMVLRSRPACQVRRPADCDGAHGAVVRSRVRQPIDADAAARIAPPRDAARTPWIEIPDAGHHVMVDQPLALVAALRTQFEAWQPAATLDPV